MQPIIERLEAMKDEMALKIATLDCMAKQLIAYAETCAKAAEELKRNLDICNGAKPK